MKPARRLGEPMVAAVSFYLIIQWVAPPGSFAQSGDNSSGADQTAQQQEERSITDGTPHGGFYNGDPLAETENGQQAGKAAPGSAVPKKPQAKIENEKLLREARYRLAPHSMLVESSLKSALDQVEGAKAQLRTAEATRANAPLSADQLSALNAAGSELLSDLNTAELHRAELRGGLEDFPAISNSQESKATDRAFSRLLPAERRLSENVRRPEFWQNRSKALDELTSLQANLDGALRAFQGFNRAQLNLPEGTFG